MNEFYFTYEPSSAPVAFPSSSSFTSSSDEFTDSISQSICSSSGSEAKPSQNISISSSHASNRLSIQHRSTSSSVSEARPSQNTSTAFSYASISEVSLDNDDAEIVVEGIPVGINLGILAEKSKIFHDLFKLKEGSGKEKYLLNELIPFGKIGYEAFLVFLSYLYTEKLNPPPLEISTCVDSECAHDACGPAIDFAVDLLYASSIFKVPKLVALFQRRLSGFAYRAYVEDVIPILVAAFYCGSNELQNQCVYRIASSNLDNISIQKMLPCDLSKIIEFYRKEPMSDAQQISVAMDSLHEKSIRRIHKALDFDDVELVHLLIGELDVTIDDTKALHYAVAYCDSKLVCEVLNRFSFDINLRNSQGFTALHLAAMRKEPSIIRFLLEKGGCVSDLTLDGRSAITICKRLTRQKNYQYKIGQWQETTYKDLLCIAILELANAGKRLKLGEVNNAQLSCME